MSSPTSDLWEHTEPLLLRAEQLLQHSLSQLEQSQQARRADRDRTALEIEQVLVPLNQLSADLTALVEAMARESSDNPRLQRWQGQLQQQLSPLEDTLLSLQELLQRLDQPLQEPAAASSGSTDTSAAARQRRDARRRQQLLQLLARRRRQVRRLQAAQPGPANSFN